jgi:hypothetical protein
MSGELDPELVAAKRAIALAPAGDKLVAIDAEALRLATLPIPNGEKTEALIDAAKANGLYRTEHQREDVEHVIRERFAGRSAGVRSVRPMGAKQTPGRQQQTLDTTPRVWSFVRNPRSQAAGYWRVP